MNTFTKYINCFLKFAFIALGIGALAMTAQAGSLDISTADVQISSAMEDFYDQKIQSEARQSLPSCGGEVQYVWSPISPDDTACICCLSGDLTCCPVGHPCLNKQPLPIVDNEDTT